MPKRKLSDLQPPSPSPSRPASSAPSRQPEHIKAHLTNSTTILHRALKIACGFERQKLGRRSKTAAAEKNLDDMRRLKLEVVALKELDLERTAERHLYRCLRRDKGVAAAGVGWEGLLGEGGDGKIGGERESTESLNVKARLFKSEGVRRAVEVAVGGVRAALGIEGGEGGERRRRRLRARDYAHGEKGEGVMMKAAGLAGEEWLVERKEEDEEMEWEGFSSPADSEPDFSADVEDDSLQKVEVNSDDERYERYAARLAASTSSEPESESDYSTPQRRRRRSPTPPSQNHIKPPDSATSISPSPSPSPSPVPQTKPHTHLPPSKLPKPTTTTTFLPTLQTSGYYSGDSDASSIIEQDFDHDGATAQPQASAGRRKNRMGQQARRALWEKKFKGRANHLLVSRSPAVGGEGGDGVKSGLKTRAQLQGQGRGKGRSNDNGVGSLNRRGRRAGAGAGGATGANGEVVGIRRRELGGVGAGVVAGENDGPLHPSWEAARKAKEAKRAAVPVGRKVVF